MSDTQSKKPGMCIIWGTNRPIDPTALYVTLDNFTFFMSCQDQECRVFTDKANVETLSTWLFNQRPYKKVVYT